MSEFDSYVDDYDSLHAENVKASGFPVSYFDEYKLREVAGHLARAGRREQELRFLNFGCGIGKSEPYIRRYLPRAAIYSVDVSRKSVARARENTRGMRDVHFRTFDGRAIPFDISFDVIFAANVFHHIPRERHLPTLRLLNGALRPEGMLFLFEHNPLNPVTVKTIRDCPFDQDAVLLSPLYTRRILARAGFRKTTIRFTLFFPKPLAALIPLEKYLRKVPFGAQYYFIARKG